MLEKTKEKIDIVLITP